MLVRISSGLPAVVIRNSLAIICVLLILSVVLAHLLQMRIGAVCTTRSAVIFVSGVGFWMGVTPLVIRQIQTNFTSSSLWVKSLLLGVGVSVINQLFVRWCIDGVLRVVFGCADAQAGWTFDVLQNNILINFICYWCIVGFAYTPLKWELSLKTAQPQTSHPPVQSYLQTVAVKNGTTTTLIPTEKILWIESDNNTITLVSQIGKFVNYQSLRSLQTELDPADFQRIHRSIIVNVNYIRKVQALSGGDALVTLTTGEQLRMSRRYKTTLPNTL